MWTMENMKYQSLEFDEDVANDTTTTVCSDDMSVCVTDVAVADKDGCERGVQRGVTKAKGVGRAKEEEEASDKQNIYHDMIYRFPCDQDGCDYKTKHAQHLKEHKANVHDIDVRWFHCDQDGCDYKAKQAGNLKVHKRRIHDVD